MIGRIEALNYRSLRHVNQDLGPFSILVGANASGKSTFLDVVAFLGHLVSEGLEAAVDSRTRNFHDLVWGRTGDHFELAVEAPIPAEIAETGKTRFGAVRYEVKIGLKPDPHELAILTEKALLLAPEEKPRTEKTQGLFPGYIRPPTTILTGRAPSNARAVIIKTEAGIDQYDEENPAHGRKGWKTRVKWGARKSALGHLPADESKFPVVSWLRGLLTEGVRSLALDSRALRLASPPGKRHGFQADGSYLPWAITNLKQTAHDRYRDWISHLRTALEDLEDVEIVERQDDRHAYLMLVYKSGLKVPSWTTSDGTLRLLALTLLAYSGDFRGAYLIEKPENGVHPLAVDAMYQSLSTVYDAQVLLATHSPVILGLADPDTVLCFAKTDQGETDIVLGSRHPALTDWRGETNLGVLFAAGVLGETGDQR